MILQGDCLHEMRKMESNSISCIVTDPPYGLGFMGKDWDAGLPHHDIWKEALRIVKPGGHLLAFGGTRTYHRLTCAIEDSGWEIRDCLMWIYGSGFPKSHNHFGIEGYGTALKPSVEPCIMAMKKCDGTFKANAEKWGQAGINIAACRISGEAKSFKDARLEKTNDIYGKYNPSDYDGTKGRWPANLILDEVASEQLGSPSRFFFCAKASSSERNEGCKDLPLGEAHSSARSKPAPGRELALGSLRQNTHPTVKPLKLMEYLIKLVMPPKDGVLLDPFCGSGSTILAALNLGVKAIGIEMNPEYCEIARARLTHAQNEFPLLKV